MVAPMGSFWFWGEMFGLIGVFVLIFAVIYGLLIKTKQVSERDDVNAVIAFALAMMLAFSGAVPYIVKIIPYFAIIFLILFVVFLIGQFIGLNTKEWMKSRYFTVTLLIVFVAIFFFLGIQEYSKSLNAGLNITSNETNITEINKTGNFVTDTINVYNSQCVATQTLAKPISGFVAICILFSPRFLGAALVLITTAIITFFVLMRER